MSWPEAFAIAVLVVSVLGYLAYDHHLRAEVMKEAIRNGHTNVRFDE